MTIHEWAYECSATHKVEAYWVYDKHNSGVQKAYCVRSEEYRSWLSWDGPRCVAAKPRSKIRRLFARIVGTKITKQIATYMTIDELMEAIRPERSAIRTEVARGQGEVSAEMDESRSEPRVVQICTEPEHGEIELQVRITYMGPRAPDEL